MTLNLSGKTALVSGSSRGIGKAVAQVLIEEGCTVFINGRDEQALDAAQQELKTGTGREQIHKICCDLTQEKNVTAALDTIRQTAGTFPDALVANIGSGRSVPGWDVDDGEWTRMFNLNFFGAVRLCSEYVRRAGDKGGSIVCISSIAGCEAIPAPLPYSTAKAALMSFVKNMSDIVASNNIRINAVSPGNVLFEGGTWDIKLKEDEKKVRDYINSTVPMKDFASPHDIAWTVAFLLSDKARFITGANFVVDGGQIRKFL